MILNLTGSLFLRSCCPIDSLPPTILLRGPPNVTSGAGITHLHWQNTAGKAISSLCLGQKTVLGRQYLSSGYFTGLQKLSLLHIALGVWCHQMSCVHILQRFQQPHGSCSGDLNCHWCQMSSTQQSGSIFQISEIKCKLWKRTSGYLSHVFFCHMDLDVCAELKEICKNCAA